MRTTARGAGGPCAAAPLHALWHDRADVLGLRWSDLHLSAGVARVRPGRVALDREYTTDDTKSGARLRTVPVEAMHPGTVTLLRSLSARQAADRLAAGPAYRDSGLVVGTAAAAE